jgi:hypothetical protein
MMKIMLKSIAAIALAASMAACDIDVPDLNNAGADSLVDHPTKTKIAAAATGLLIGTRANIGIEAGLVSHLGILGRESYNFDPADPRYVEELLSGELDPGGGAFGGSFWTPQYANIKSANLIFHALEKVPDMTEAEKQGTRGFALTIQALDFLVVIETHDKNGAVIDTDVALDAPLPPIASKKDVYTHIKKLLDDGATALAAGGDSFAFPLSSGFKGFDTPATFLTFNRALKARADVYSDDWNAALTDLMGSFLSADPMKPDLDVGVYYSFSTGTGDALNFLVDSSKIVAHPSIVADEDKKADGSDDDRVTRKIVKLPATAKGEGGKLKTDYAFKMYPSPSSPIPLIRNEELILLRAEANIGLGTPAGLAAAIDDINFIRVHSGGLAPRTDLTSANILDELLKQKRYSLLFEGGHRWIDMRHYGKLDQLPLDTMLDSPVVYDAFPIPSPETDARQ